MWFKVIMVLLLLASSAAMGQQSSKLKEIVESFYSTYDVSDEGYGRVNFEKRVDKWYVTTVEVEGSVLKPVKTYLYYDEASGYKQLKFMRTRHTDSVNYTDYIDEWQEYNYNLHPFFGYNGWFKDVINYYERKARLTNDQLYSLGRAYSAYASALTIDPNREAIKEEQFNCPLQVNCLTNQQITKYNGIIAKAQKSFQQLAKRDPAYSTKIGPITIKYANEHLVQLNILLTLADNYARSMQLPNGIYPDSLLAKSREMLNDCPRGAIYLSFGDNDFYPLLYLQHKEKFRPDVYVLSYNLLALDHFTFRSTHPQFQSKGISLSLDTADYKREANDYFIVKDSIPSLAVDDIIKIARHGETYLVYPARLMPTKEFRVNLKAEGNTQTMAVLKYKGDYMFKHQLVLLDILHNLAGRKICFSNVFTDELEDLNKYLSEQGSVWMYNN